MPLHRNPAEAIAWANAQTSGFAHSCLAFVKQAYYGDNPTQNSLDGKPFLDEAHVGWDNSSMKHTDRNPPVGALMYFAGAHPGDPGDVQLVTGPVITRRTDVGAWGRIATTDIWWMERVVGRRYLGWTGDILGYPYFGVGVQPETKPEPEPEEEEVTDMGRSVLSEVGGKKRLLGNIDGNIVTFSSSKDLTTFMGNKGTEIVKLTTGVFNKYLLRANK